MSTTIPGPDGRPRCRWCAAAPEFLAYHDTETGAPVAQLKLRARDGRPVSWADTEVRKINSN